MVGVTLLPHTVKLVCFSGGGGQKTSPSILKFSAVNKKFGAAAEQVFPMNFMLENSAIISSFHFRIGGADIYWTTYIVNSKICPCTCRIEILCKIQSLCHSDGGMSHDNTPHSSE